MKYTLIADGSSDRVLLPILTWLLKKHGVESVQEQWADFSRLPRAGTLEERARVAVDYYPCEVLFVHRDVEKQDPAERRKQVFEALKLQPFKHIPVIPVRMTEAWLLCDETAIRSAAGNPNGREPLNLPPVRQLENVPDPKEVLFRVLEKASGLNDRRLAAFRPHKRVHLIPNYVRDYSALQALPAFAALQSDIQAVLP